MNSSSAFEAAFAAVRRGYAFRTVNGAGIYTLPAFSTLPGIDHGFSSRTGGISTGAYASMNLSFTRPDEKRETVMENYRLFCKAADIPVDSVVMDSFEHGTTVLRVDWRDCGRGYTREPLPPCDGLVTDDPAVALMTGHADCMAFYLADPVKRCIGLAHAGWRGALGRIGSELVRMLAKEYGSNPADLIAGVGPGICPDCFEVGEDVGRDFAEAFPLARCVRPGKPGKNMVDLQRVAACQFLETGVRPERISFMDVCTMEDDRLFSHRRDHGNTGAMTAYLRLKDDKTAAFSWLD